MVEALAILATLVLMDTSLDHLEARFRVKVFELLARAVEARVPVIVTNTLRTAAEQADLVKRGLSWRAHSAHQDGLAIDLVPLQTYVLHGVNKAEWDTSDPVWETLARIGEALGLVAGLRWKQRDAGHFEQGT